MYIFTHKHTYILKIKEQTSKTCTENKNTNTYSNAQMLPSIYDPKPQIPIYGSVNLRYKEIYKNILKIETLSNITIKQKQICAHKLHKETTTHKHLSKHRYTNKNEHTCPITHLPTN